MKERRDALIEDLAAVGGFLVIIAGAWFLAGREIAGAAAVPSAVISLPAACLGDLLERLGGIEIPFLTAWLIIPAQTAREIFFTVPLADLGDEAARINEAGGRSAVLFLAPVCLCAALACLGTRADLACRTRHDLDSLTRSQAKVWASAERPTRTDPSSDSEPDTGGTVAEAAAELERAAKAGRKKSGGGAETGSELLPPQPEVKEPPPLGRALRPEEWIACCALPEDDSGGAAASIEAALAAQLSRPWTGAADLRPHERAFAACLGRFAEDPDRAGKLIDELSHTFAGGRRPGDAAAALDADPDLAAKVEAELEAGGERLNALAAGHWWVETALAEIWRSGRAGGGVLPSARFLWLKPEDRGLWYAVSCTGGNPVIEAAGIRAHHLAELHFGFPLPAPRVRQARLALMNVYFDRAPRARRRRSSDPSAAELVDAALKGGAGAKAED